MDDDYFIIFTISFIIGSVLNLDDGITKGLFKINGRNFAGNSRHQRFS